MNIVISLIKLVIRMNKQSSYFVPEVITINVVIVNNAMIHSISDYRTMKYIIRKYICIEKFDFPAIARWRRNNEGISVINHVFVALLLTKSGANLHSILQDVSLKSGLDFVSNQLVTPRLQHWELLLRTRLRAFRHFAISGGSKFAASSKNADFSIFPARFPCVCAGHLQLLLTFERLESGAFGNSRFNFD